jgi:hypothetical protein
MNNGTGQGPHLDPPFMTCAPGTMCAVNDRYTCTLADTLDLNLLNDRQSCAKKGNDGPTQIVHTLFMCWPLEKASSCLKLGTGSSHPSHSSHRNPSIQIWGRGNGHPSWEYGVQSLLSHAVRVTSGGCLGDWGHMKIPGCSRWKGLCNRQNQASEGGLPKDLPDRFENRTGSPIV